MTTKERFKEALKIYKPEVCDRLFRNLDKEGLNWDHSNSKEDLSWILACKMTWKKTPEGGEYWTSVHRHLLGLEKMDATKEERGHILRAFRRQRPGITTAQLSRESGVARRVLDDVFNHGHNPSQATFSRLIPVMEKYGADLKELKQNIN